MTTATFNALPIANVPVWRHLLWKDFRQLWPLIIGIAAIEASLQLMLGLFEFTFAGDTKGLSYGAINIALASPTLLAIACSGVLIGQERQTGCWTWNSSLPVSWQQSLLSKVFVWLGTSFVTIGLLLAIAAIVLRMNHTSLILELFTRRTDASVWTQLMTLIIALQVFIYLSIATLMIKDTLMAIVIAAFGLFIFHSAVALFNLISISNRLNGLGYNQNHEVIILLAYLGSSVIGAILLAVTYRWRWGTGQYARLSFFGGTSQEFARPQRAAWSSYAVSATQPSELSMLLQHGLRSSFFLRMTVFCGAVLAIFAEPGAPGATAAFLASCLLGISVFSGEQTLNRYRFLADRGVDWKKLLLSLNLLPIALTLVLTAFAAATAGTFAQDQGWVYAACMSVFVVGTFSSLVFPSSIVSIAVALSVTLGAYSICGLAFQIWDSVAPGYAFAIAVWMPFAVLFVLICMIRQVPQWLIKERLNATGPYFRSMLVAAILPLIFGLSWGFMFIPKAAWQGTPIEQIKPMDWSGGPDLTAWSGAVTIEPTVALAGDMGRALEGSQLNSHLQQQIEEQEIDPTWTASEDKLLTAIEVGGSKPANLDYRASTNLNNMVKCSAAYALVATQKRKKDHAIRLWKANRKLIAFCQQPALQSSTIESVCYVWEIWNTLQDDDLRFLLDTNELPDLTPIPRLTPEQFREVLRARGTLHQLRLRRTNAAPQDYFVSGSLDWYGRTGFQAYPPIRWAYERQHALALSDDLRLVRPTTIASFTQFTDSFHDPLVHKYWLQAFMEEKFAQRISRLQALRKAEGAQLPESGAKNSE